MDKDAKEFEGMAPINEEMYDNMRPSTPSDNPRVLEEEKKELFGNNKKDK